MASLGGCAEFCAALTGDLNYRARERPRRRTHCSCASLMPATGSPSLRLPRILVIAADQPLRDFCRDGLPWAGCAIEFVRDLTDALTCGFDPDVVLFDVPADRGSSVLFQHLCEYAEAIGSSVIALSDDFDLLRRPPRNRVQVVLWPCPPETLWDALAVAIAGGDREGVGSQRDEGGDSRGDQGDQEGIHREIRETRESPQGGRADQGAIKQESQPDLLNKA
jgi:hypothetical protein